MSNLPAVPEPEPSRALTPVDSWIPVLADVAALAERVASTEFVPKGLRDSPPAVAAAILYGREVGLPPMTALNVTHVIEGKPAISAEGMRAMVFAAGHEIVIEDSTGAQCIVKGRRRGQEEWTRIGWNIDMARAAGVAGKQVWQRYPRQMLQARATAELCRLVFPDVTHGFRAVEEIDDGYEDGPEAPPQPVAPGTRVARKRAPARKALAAAPAPREERPEAPSGPPLPGEDGYTSSEGEQAPGVGVRSSPRSAGSEPELGGVSPSGAPGQESGPRGGDPDSADDTGTDHEPGACVTEEPPAGETEGEAVEPAGGSEEEPPAPRGPRMSSRGQHRAIFALLDPLDVKTDEDRYDVATAIVGHRIGSFNDLTHANASAMIETLGRVGDREQLDVLLASAAGGAA